MTDVNEILYRLLEREQAKVPCSYSSCVGGITRDGGQSSQRTCGGCGGVGVVPDPTIPSWLTVLLHGVAASEGKPCFVCPICGEGAAADEDGCCRVCGSDTTPGRINATSAMDGLMVRCKCGDGRVAKFNGQTRPHRTCRGTGDVPNPLFAELVSKGLVLPAAAMVEQLLRAVGFGVLSPERSRNAYTKYLVTNTGTYGWWVWARQTGSLPRRRLRGCWRGGE